MFCSWLAKLRKLLRSASECHTFWLLSCLLSSFQGFDQDCQESDQWCPVQHFQAGAFNRNTTYLLDFVNANHFCYEWYWSGPQRGGDDSGTSSVTNHQVWPSGISFYLSWFVAMMFKQVDHPYSALLKYAKCLKGDKPKLQKMVGFIYILPLWPTMNLYYRLTVLKFRYRCPGHLSMIVCAQLSVYSGSQK